MAQYARRLIAAGARFIGGCCGTTPEHIRRIRECVADARPRRVAVGAPAGPHARAGGSRTGAARRSAREWGRKLADGDVRAQRGGGASARLGSRHACCSRCRALREAGVDAVNLAGRPARAEPHGGRARRAHHRARGRTRDGLPLHLPRPQHARHAERPARRGGRRPAKRADRHRRSADRRALPRRDRRLRHRQHRPHQRGAPAEPRARPRRRPRSASPPGSSIGVAANQGAVDLELELERFHWKVEAGAEFAVTQPVFDPEELAGSSSGSRRGGFR